MMKKHTFFLLIGISFFCAFSSYAQKTKINLNVKMGTIKEVTAEIEKKSDFIFVFADDTETLLNRKVNIVSEGQSVESILNNVFANTELRYRMLDKQIVIYREKAVEPSKKTTKEIPEQKKVTITGKVTDSNKEPLVGVSILEVGTSNGTITDFNGEYSIAVKSSKPILRFTYLGYEQQQVDIGNRTFVQLIMKESSEELDEVVVVGYGIQKRASVTGAVSSVSDKEIMKAPTMSISNVVGARVAGISAVQTSGQPGANDAALRVRGQTGVIYVIDGIKRTSADFNGLDPNEIESVSVLKDASAIAVYGLDANGAFIVTTKKGNRQKMSINYSGSVGISNNADQQVWLDGPGYAYWYNKARVLDGDAEVFSIDMVRKMREGVDGWGNTNWYNEMYGTGVKQHHNISANGGDEKINFFTSIGFFDEKGNLENYNYNRYNVRSNIEAQLTQTIKMSLGLSGRLEKRSTPRYTANPDDYRNVPQQIVYAVPYVPKTIDKDGKTYYVSTPTSSSHVSPLASVRESGYNDNERVYIASNFALEYKPVKVDGLKFRAVISYDLLDTKSKMLQKPYETMIANKPNLNTTNLTYSLGTDVSKNIMLLESFTRGYYMTTQTSLHYDKVIGKHTINLLALAETRETGSGNMSATGYGLDFLQLDELNNITNQTGDGTEKFPSVGGASSQTRVAGFVGRINYDYNQRYLLEASVRRDGSYLFGGMNKRWITLPGLSIGWRVNNEEWFKASWVENLKLRGGVGKTAISGISPFLWQNTMSISQNAVVIGGNSVSGINASVLGNPNLTWEQCVNYNLGYDATILKGLFGMEFDVFYKYEWDKLSSVTGSYSPSIGGYYFTTANVNKADYKGFDLTFSHNNRIREFKYGAKLIWSYSYGRWLKYSGDADNTPDYLKLTGKQIGSKIGFVADGLFQDEDEIEKSATIPGSAVVPGYIKYVDRNGDGVITYAQDMGYVGKSSIPTHMGSLNLYGEWRGFDFDMLFSWGLGHEVALSGLYTATGSAGVQSYTAFTKAFYQGGNSLAYMIENSWIPGKTDAEFPRLSITNISNNNAYASTFFYRKGNYMRFKTIQVGYTFPSKLVKHIGINAARIFMDGYNIFTLSSLSKYNIDPESPAVNNGYYPQQRTFSLGAKLTF